jgi:preprotein translocase subunit SecA
MEEGEPIEHKLVSRAIENAQKKVEAHNFDIRKHLIEYDDVMNKHREVIYSLRKEALDGDRIGEIVGNMIAEKVDGLVGQYTDPKVHPEQWDIQGLIDGYLRQFGLMPKISQQDLGQEEFDRLKVEDLSEMLLEQANKAYAEKEKLFGKELEQIERFIILQIIDDQWTAHLQDMDHMKGGIGLRGYGQLDPLKEYQKEGFALFEGIMDRISSESLRMLFRIQLAKRPQEEIPVRKRQKLNLSHGGDGPVTVRRSEKKVGRNEPCPCGSGKKYKRCCGAAA